MTERSDMAIILLGYVTGGILKPEFKEFFKVKRISCPNTPDGGVPEFCEIEFASGTTVRVRVEDAPK